MGTIGYFQIKYKYPLFVWFFLCLGQILHGQSEKDTAKIITISNKNRGVKDCLFNKGLIWFIGKDGVLSVLDEKSYAVRKTFAWKTPIVAIAKDTAGQIIVADSIGTISRINNNYDTSVLWTIDPYVQNVLKIIINSQNSIFLITDRGIFVPEYWRLYYEHAFSKSILAGFNEYEWHPSCYYLDKEDDLWLGFNHGEWGGDVIIFSTYRKRFIRLQERNISHCYLNTRSIFPVNDTLYATSSLMHMGYVNSDILKLTDSCSKLFEGDYDWPKPVNYYKEEPLYMGPGTYNPHDSCIYFYCQHGVFKGHIKKDLSRLKNWQLAFTTRLSWKYGQPDAVGYAMNVSRMFFEGDKLFMVSPGNGVLIWDGRQKVLIK